MTKRKIIVFSTVIGIVLTTLIITNYLNNDGVVIASGKSDKSDKSVISTNALTMMYETEYQSGEYQVSSDTTWPQDGYVFNETLSKCENGGVLSWDAETNKVVMQTSSSDRCYVYFDVDIDKI